MNESSKRVLERSAFVVFFAAGVLAVRFYKVSHRPTEPPAKAENQQPAEEAFRKKFAEFRAKEAAAHAARVKRLGEAGAKAQEDRCDAELMAAFRAAVDKKPDVKTPDCDEQGEQR